MNSRTWSLRQRTRIAYGLLGLVVLLGFSFAAVTFNQFVDARQRFADQIDPAALATERWLTALVDQQTGVRGFVLTADDRFLEPYQAGRNQATLDEAKIRANLHEPEVTARVTAMADAVDRWRSASAAPLLARTRAGGAGTVTIADLDQTMARFDTVRDRYQDLASEIDGIRTRSRNNIDQRVRHLAITAGGAFALILVGLLATWLFLQRLVLGPLVELGQDTRQVTSGALDHKVATNGPPEIAALAADVEAMRARIRADMIAVSVTSDLLEQQRADLARSNEELEQFAYVASHDLQEPLRKVTGFCQLLQRRYEGQIDERADEYIAFAVDGAKRMQVLINDLLTFSRVGRTTESFVPVDLAATAQHAINSLTQVIVDADAVVEIGPLPTIPGDATLLEALVMNLIANAVKFRSENPPHIELSAQLADDGDTWNLVCVDNGIGIEAAYAERIFVIFQRLHGRDAYEGTGIGLAMCRKIVEFHGGRIWVDTEAPGPGATIRWTLPVEPATIAGSSSVKEPDLALAGDQP